MIDTLPPAALRSDPPEVFVPKEDAWRVAMVTLVAQFNAAILAMNLNATSDTSASSVAIGTGAKSFAVSAGKSFLGGMFLVIADTAAPSTNWMAGQVTSYSGTALVMNILTVGGSGTKSAWTISQSATGVAGGAVVAGAGANNDITALLALTSVPLNLNLPLLNGYVDWSIAANALTASIKTYAGADPSVAAPVFAVFRDPTLTNGGYFVRPITAALSVVASSGSTLGTVSAQASRIRAVVMDNGGTVVLGLYNSWVDATKSLKGLSEGAVYTSTAEGGAGAADSAQVIYTTAAQTNKSIREVSYVDSTQTTAGTWAQALTNKVQITSTTPKTGAVLQTINTPSGAVITGTTVMPNDDTIPQSSEGVALSALDTAITATSASNVAEVDVLIGVTANSAGGLFTLALFEDAVANALAAVSAQPGGATQVQMHLCGYQKVINTVSSKTFKPRLGASAAGTQTVNGVGGARLHGSVSWSTCLVKEIMV